MVASFFDQLGQPGGPYSSARNILLETYRKLQSEQPQQSAAPMPMGSGPQVPQVLRSPITLPPGIGTQAGNPFAPPPNIMQQQPQAAQNPFANVGFQPGGGGNQGDPGAGMPAGTRSLGAVAGLLGPIGTTIRGLLGEMGLDLGPASLDVSTMADVQPSNPETIGRGGAANGFPRTFRGGLSPNPGNPGK